MAGLALRNVKKTYGAVEVIHNLDLDIVDGEFLVLVGPSGCGKSTLLRMIAGLEDITDGTIAIGDKIVNDLPASKRDLSMVFQSYALYPHMSVRKNLAFGLQNMKIDRQEIQRRVEETARILQIEALMDRKPRQLSGGQKQRVAIGRSIVREPRLFLFDEPLSNLDAELRVQMRVELAELYQRLGTTMIYVTHDQVEAMTMATRIVVMRSGNIEQIGTPHELYNRPANLFVAGFIGSPKINLFKSRYSDTGGSQTIHLSDFGECAVPKIQGLGGDLTIGIRPEAVKLNDDKGSASCTGTVSLVEYLGSGTMVYVTLPSGQSILANTDGRDGVQAGQNVSVSFDAGELHYFDQDGQRCEPAEAEAIA